MNDDDHPVLPHGSDGQLLSVFSQREIATLGKLAGLFGEDERFESLKELIRAWLTLNGFGWVGRMLIFGVVSLASLVTAATVIAHWATSDLGGGAK